jgi:hypothetical protein
MKQSPNSATALEITQCSENRSPIKWNHTHNVRYLIFYVVKYVVAIHEKNDISNEKIASNCLIIVDALVNNKIKSEDVLFSNEEIVAINGINIDGNGYIIIFQRKIA